MVQSRKNAGPNLVVRVGFWIFLSALGCKWHIICQLKSGRKQNMVLGPGLVTIAVNHGAMELVEDLDRLVDVDDCKDA